MPGQVTVAGGVCESVLQFAHQSGKNAGGGEAAGDGDFLAQVTLGEAGHLDVMDREAHLRQRGDEHAQGDGLAGAGGSDEGGTYALVHRLGECGGDLCLRKVLRCAPKGEVREYRLR